MIYPAHRLRRAYKCDRCHGQLYPNELVHFIDGYLVCPDCFFDFAFDYFSDDLVLVRDIPELLSKN
ncbi:MAG: hypothetical protein ACI3VB_00225 [Oscillospiraceae bacterium]